MPFSSSRRSCSRLGKGEGGGWGYGTNPAQCPGAEVTWGAPGQVWLSGRTMAGHVQPQQTHLLRSAGRGLQQAVRRGRGARAYSSPDVLLPRGHPGGSPCPWEGLCGNSRVCWLHGAVSSAASPAGLGSLHQAGGTPGGQRRCLLLLMPSLPCSALGRRGQLQGFPRSSDLAARPTDFI